jgi:methyl-accepting chemotaxis protein
MKNWSIAKRITFGFAAVLILFSATAITSYVMLKRVKATEDAIVKQALPGLDCAARIKAVASEIQIGVLRHILAKDPTDKTGFEKRLAELKDQNQKNLDEAKALIHTDEGREKFAAIDTARTAYIAARGPVLELSRAGKSDEAAQLNKSSLRERYSAFQKACDDFYDWAEASATTAGTTGDQTIRLTNVITSSLSVSGIVLGVLIAGIIIVGTSRVLRSVASSLNDGADQVASASSQVASASQTLAEGASEQAASLEETSASLEEMTSMVKRNADSAQQAKEISSQTRVAADTGARDMEQMQSSMAAIKTSSDEIAKIVKNIDEIAFQTNILALNAAVEAARAGEAGAGFAVVADEVRNLAQRSAQAAKETANKIEDAIAKTTQGVQVSGKVAESLKQIIEKARTVDDLVGEIAAASKEQSQGISQVNTAVTQMDKVTQSNAATAEESASASEELSSQAQAVKDSVETLQALVGGAGRDQRSSVQGDEISNQPAPAKKRAASKPVTRISAHSSGNGRQELATLVTNGRNSAELPMPQESEFKDF